MNRTIDTILATIEKNVVESAILPPSVWVDASLAMTALLGHESDALFLAQQKIAQKKASLVEAGDSVALATLKSQATDEWVEMKKIEAKIGRVEEMIRCAKLRARMADSELRS